MLKKNKLKRIDTKNQEVTKYDFIICPNCGAEEVGKFCPNCGQSNKDFNKPVKEIFGDLLDSINLDIRLVNSLIPFFIKPGFLTEEYFKGKRKRYVPPMRMYILFSVLFFFLAQFANIEEFKGMGTISNDSTDSLSHNTSALVNESNVMLNPDGFSNYALRDSSKINEIKQEKPDSNDNRSFDELSTEEKKEIIEEIKADTTISDGIKKLTIGALNTTENIQVFWEKLLNNISYVLFILMPFFALILAMTLWKSKKMYVHHLIFSINFHSFIFAFSSLIIVLGMILPEKFYQFSSYLFLIFFLYLMFGIKQFYKKTYIKSFFKAFGIISLYLFIILIAFAVILAITAQGFYEA